MKHSFIRSVSIVTTAALFFAGCAVTSHTEKVAGADFSQYKTFSWANDNNIKKEDRVSSDIVDNNIKNSISEELVQPRTYCWIIISWLKEASGGKATRFILIPIYLICMDEEAFTVSGIHPL